ncbi:hypothetical protein, variant [Aphanomyces invadans]|nr:hypothetical protein, variant [Aphanomyces invadans]ETW09163.1 hypothetical protein, variant [Aphanomyces invadans]|eukprot:XP_008862968.1 hypothetical protein, variant [Aphanomyces invadans]
MAKPTRQRLENELDTQESPEVDIEDLMHSLGSFQAVLLPVTLTMVLSSFASILIRDPDAAAQMAQAYLVYKPDDSDSDSALLGHAFVNALAIVCFFIVATFVIVICYKFKFTNFLVGYMFLSSAVLLGFLGGRLAEVALENLSVPVDVWSYWFIMYNFAVVGVLSIFYQKGVNMSLTQSYLVAVSIIMAWQLSKFPEWTTWALVVVLAFYDLCAVLTPCGPLKCLVNLIQQEGRPLPGLLYEAEVQRTFHSDAHSPSYYQRGGPPCPEQATGTQTTCTFTRRRSRPDDSHEPLLAAASSTDTSEMTTTAKLPLRDRLVAFYNEYNPSAIERVDQVLAIYEGRERDLWNDLAAKYGPHDDDEDDNTIKLGLGDFVFYSVLVSRAAMFDVMAMIACLVSILMGLGSTLFLLSVYKKALPALPISILLGVAIYLWVRFVLVDFMDSTVVMQ